MKDNKLTTWGYGNGRFKLGFVFTLQLLFKKKKVYLNNNKINFQFFNGVLSEESSNLKIILHPNLKSFYILMQQWSSTGHRPGAQAGQKRRKVKCCRTRGQTSGSQFFIFFYPSLTKPQIHNCQQFNQFSQFPFDF